MASRAGNPAHLVATRPFPPGLATLHGNNPFLPCLPYVKSKHCAIGNISLPLSHLTAGNMYETTVGGDGCIRESQRQASVSADPVRWQVHGRDGASAGQSTAGDNWALLPS